MTAAPTMPAWNLGLRFALELAAVAGLAIAAWRVSPGAMRWPAAAVVAVAAMGIWTTFNVPGDPSRSGEAPVVVPGVVRLVLELTILVAGAVALALRGTRWVGVAVGALLVVHYAASARRVGWLLDQ